MGTKFILAGVALFTMVGMFGCDGPKPEDSMDLYTAAKCETDKTCADDFICKDKKCVKGKRSKKEKAAARKKVRDEKAAALAKKHATKPGEGRLDVRMCPGFKNTPEAMGTIIAEHQETHKKHYIHLAQVVPDGNGWETEFSFYSLPLGTYDVTAKYGIQVKGVADIVLLPCHKERVKNKECRDGNIREVEVVLPPKEPVKRAVNEKGKIVFWPCDWSVE